MEKLIHQALNAMNSGGGLLVSTAGRSGIPHITSAGEAHLSPDGRITIKEWFCPRTLENLSENKNVSILIYDPVTREGNQIIGRVEAINDTAVMNGFMPDHEPALPQMERELIVRVDAVLDYSHGPHTDKPVGQTNS